MVSLSLGGSTPRTNDDDVTGVGATISGSLDREKKTHQTSQSASAAVGGDTYTSQAVEDSTPAFLVSPEIPRSPDPCDSSDVCPSPSESEETGSELYRVSTAPSVTTRNSLPHKRDLSRPMGNDTKLRRMGFDVAARQQPSSLTTPKRFGGLKSLMQTLKGRP